MGLTDERPRAALALAAAAGLIGAAGVALGAVAAHRIPEPALVTASQMLIIHAAAVLGVTAWAARSPAAARWWQMAAAALVFGVALFAADIAARAILGDRLFPMAAPMGGNLMILGWLLVAAAAIKEGLRSGNGSPR